MGDPTAVPALLRKGGSLELLFGLTLSTTEDLSTAVIGWPQSDARWRFTGAGANLRLPRPRGIPVHLSTAIPLVVCVLCARGANYTTYIGDAFAYQVAAIATDANGTTYITGSRAIVVPPTGSPVTDVFVSKLDASGNLSLIGTFSGKGTDHANGIAADPSGNIYVVGTTTSTDFPLRHPLQSTAAHPSFEPGLSEGTGFLIKLTADGSVVYSTYLGGTLAPSSLSSVVADSKGNAYVTGWTLASDYPHTAGLPAGTVGLGIGSISGAFFAKIDPAGDQILYAGTLSTMEHACGAGSSCFLSEIFTSGTAIAVDTAGNAYIAGNTSGVGLPTTPGALLTAGIGAFVAKVNAAGTGLAYLTFLGAANYFPPPVAPSSDPGNLVFAIAADAAGNAYIAGSTSDPAFPATASAFQPKLSLANQEPNPFEAPPADAFVAKLNPTGSAMEWATFLGGTGSDQAQTITVDSTGAVWVSGVTQSTNFPHTFAWPNGDEFLAELNSTGSALSYSALLPGNSVAAGLAVDAGGIVHMAGATGLVSAFTPGSAPGQTSSPWMFGITNAAGGVLAGRVAAGELVSIYGLHLGPLAPVSATFNAAGFLPTSLGGLEVTVNGLPVPLLYVSDTQINAVAPVELTVGSTELQVVQNGAPLSGFRIVTDIAAPQIFRNPGGSAAAINQGGTVNSAAHPAKAGSFVSVWATGAGFFPGSDGQIASGANAFCACEIFSEFDSTQANVSYSGAAPGLVNGVVQINFQVAAGVGSYYLSVDRINSDAFSIFVAP